jgi:GntR family transcriptional regulator, gluconate operon transcriptional repressor
MFLEPDGDDIFGTLDLIERNDPLVERVLVQMTTAIVTGTLASGDKLVETRLGEQLGVSRGPIREAFRRLEQMGLVEKIPYRGTFVTTLTENDINELNTVRLPLEGIAARLLAGRRDEQAVERLRAILREMRAAATLGDAGRMIMLDVDFHDALVAQSGHKLLNELWPLVSLRLRRFLFLKRRRLYQRLEDAAGLHAPIIEAIAEGDAGQAEAMAHQHVIEGGRLMGNERARLVAEGELLE